MQKPKLTTEAFKEEGGPILLLAGPGTGKTFQLAKRIKFLLSKGASPTEITVITFTREAAKSMKAKIAEDGKEEFIPEADRPAQISTMHSLGHQIIGENPDLVGLRSDFGVLESEQIKDILVQDSALSLGYSHEQAKAASYDRRTANPSKSKESKAILDRYEQVLRSINVVDHDDQISLAIRILKNDAQVLSKYAGSAKYLLVDEYQDINNDQFELVSLLSSQFPTGLFVVGDDDQSIYNFRGATPTFIRKFVEQLGKEAAVLQMSKSWRCKRAILLSSLAVVQTYDPDRVDKGSPEFAKQEEGEVIVHDCPTDEKEAQVIASVIRDEIGKSGSNKYTAFILVPSRLYAGKIQTALENQGIKYDINRTPSAAALEFTNFSKWADNPDDSLACRVVIDSIIDGLKFQPGKVKEGKSKSRQAIASLWQPAIVENISLWQMLQRQAKTEPLLQPIVERILTLKKAYTASLSEFIARCVEYLRPWGSKEAFLNEMREMALPREGGPGCYEIRILTFQKSKGLEANTVFLVGLEEGSLPKSGEAHAIPESARLLFVGMTRAKDNLHLMHSSTRSGAATLTKKSHQMQRSRLLDALPKELCKSKYHQRKSKVRVAQAKG